MATIADVAKLAGVSAMTVSRVVNNSSHVSEITKKRVLDAIEKLSYRPNMVARGLVTRQNRMIAYVLSNLINPFFANVNVGIENVCTQRGYTVIVYDVKDENSLNYGIDMLIDRRIDGVVFHHLNIRQEQADMLKKNGIKCVTIDNEQELEGVTSVDSDNYEAAREATRHLIDKGFTRIGCVHGRVDDSSEQKYAEEEYTETFQRRIWQQRTQGFLDEMHAAGLEPVCMLEGRASANMRYVNDQTNLARALDANPQALYCENDIMALAVMGECLKCGMRMREDLSLVGHDGLDFAILLYPRLTTMCQPMQEMGTLAAEKLLDAIEHNIPPERLKTKSKLYQGDTT